MALHAGERQGVLQGLARVQDAGPGLHHATLKFLASVRERLLEFAAHQFKLQRRSGDGKSSQGDHLKSAAKHPLAALVATTTQKELVGPPCPAAAEHIWAWYRELDSGRTSSGLGPNPVTWLDMDAFFRPQGIELRDYEREWLRALDRDAMRAASETKP